MKVAGFPTEWDEQEGLQLIDIQDLQIEANSEDLDRLSIFLKECSESHKNGSLGPRSVHFGDSKPNPKTGITITVLPCDT